ncbi:MAG: inorganic phosphate transporter, partial [Bacilli bacterium]|nr:inorganic phosphate transporter [Bacilli bacterium]
MAISFGAFIQLLLTSPAIAVTVVLTLGVVLVNGWTDAPNAIATCVSTRSMTTRNAILMAAVFNFLGVFAMTAINAKVAQTMAKMVDFGGNTDDAVVALCAALFAIVVWATAAWYFGIPTSESHALIAGVSGAAIALQGGISGINGAEWIKVLYGLVLSTVLGLSLGFLVVKLVGALFKDIERQSTTTFFRNSQIAGAAAMAFMHGAQDGQKFIGIFLLGIALAQGNAATDFMIPVWLMLLCSTVMALGTAIGGGKIIKTVGVNMVKLETYQGFSADFAGALSLLTASLFGLPVSTTHTKTTAIMGV